MAANVDVLSIFFVILQQKTFLTFLIMKQFTLILVALAAMCTQSFAQNRVKNIYADANTLKVEMLNTDQTVQINRSMLVTTPSVCLCP